MPALTKADWADIRHKWEAGAAKSALAKEYGVSTTSVSDHQKREGWVKFDEQPIAAVEADDIPVTSNNGYVDPDIFMPVAPATDEAEALRRKVAALETELAAFKPLTVEWPVDEKSAARMLADQMDDLIEGELEQLNMERAKRGRPAMSVAEMEASNPKWYQAQVDRIIREAVDALTKYATNEGPALRTIAFMKPDGKNRIKLALASNIGGGPVAFIEKQKAKGFKELEPRVCWRNDCWKLARQDFHGYCGELHMSLDPFAGREAQTVATTTGSFNIR